MTWSCRFIGYEVEDGDRFYSIRRGISSKRTARA